MLMQNKSLDMTRINNKTSIVKKDLSKFLDFKPYKPTKSEKYMSSGQISHFKNILHEWKKLLINEADKTVEHMKNDSSKSPILLITNLGISINEPLIASTS